jgi:hypothetical protein
VHGEPRCDHHDGRREPAEDRRVAAKKSRLVATTPTTPAAEPFRSGDEYRIARSAPSP